MQHKRHDDQACYNSVEKIRMEYDDDAADARRLVFLYTIEILFGS